LLLLPVLRSVQSSVWAGTFVSQPNLQALLWGIDAVGLVMAAALLALKYYRSGDDLVAGGFLVFSIGEATLLSGTAAGLAASVPAFAAGTALWATALLLVSVPRDLPNVARVFGIGSAILFAIVAARLFWGEQLLPTSAPLPFYAYPFLVMTLLSWIWTLLRERR
jgi:hypothetical protein